MPVSLNPPIFRGVIQCGHCPHQIVLPFPTRPPTSEDQTLWPNRRDYLYVACPACRTVAGYIDYHGTAPHRAPTPDDEILICISYRCAAFPCGIPVQFHVLADSTTTDTTENEWRGLLTRGYWIGLLPCRHAPGTVGNQKVCVDVIEAQTLRGYNRERLETQIP